MGANDLHDPLGLDRPAASPPRRKAPWGWAVLGGLGLATGGLVVYSLAIDNGMGGRPYAEAVVERPRPQEAPPQALAPPPVMAAAQPALPVLREGTPFNPSGAAVIDAQTGARLPRQAGVEGSGPLILRAPEADASVAQSVLPQAARSSGLQLTQAPDPRLVEKGRHGPLPRIGADGSRPSEIYARPLVSGALKPGAPRIALVVGGMGLNAAATSAAIETLPGAVTLGFAPYGGALDRQVQEARAAGHELVLQTPMVPMDKSAIPGANTLLAGVETAQNLDSLRWHLSRMTGYVGVANFLGGRFMTREADLAPVMREIAGRGLLFLDDGTAAQSLATTLAASVGAPAARADVVVDASPRPEAIEAALARLEALARAKGSAIGYAAGLPGAMEAVARFAQGLERRGVALVPLSALTARGPASAGLTR